MPHYPWQPCLIVTLLSCADKYSGAEMCWLFETIEDGKYVMDSVSSNKGTLHNVSSKPFILYTIVRNILLESSGLEFYQEPVTQ